MKKSKKPLSKDSLTVADFFHDYHHPLKLHLLAGQAGLHRMIGDMGINRPALALTGYFKHFGHKRIQLFGAGEMGYFHDLSERRQRKVLQAMIDHKIPCIIVTCKIAPTKTMLMVAAENNIPLFRTQFTSKGFTAECTLLLERRFAPETRLHGTLLDVKGVGTLLRGDSGVGKSECALALIERGHSLVADDVCIFKLVGEVDLLGRSHELNRGYMECRGLGIINIAELFGIRSLRLEKRLDLVVTFQEWKPGMPEERTGLEESYFTILKQKIPHVEIPVRPGRDLARLVEVAAMVLALKKMGHNSAQEFNKRLINHMTQSN